MLHLSTERYNNEEVSKVLGRISSETCLKIDYFGSKSPKIAMHRGPMPPIQTPVFVK